MMNLYEVSLTGITVDNRHIRVSRLINTMIFISFEKYMICLDFSIVKLNEKKIYLHLYYYYLVFY